MWTLIPLLFPLFLDCNGYGISAISYNYNQLYKGNRCQLKNGSGEGICLKLIDCPRVIQEIHDGIYTGADHCGFEDFDEIVCCAVQPTLKSRGQIRPAEAACEEYRQIPEISNFEEMLRISVYYGIRANAFEFPYMAALGYSISEEEAARGVKYICGGTLISQKHVLTAAHCVNNIHGLKPHEVLLGTNDLNNLEAGEVQRIPISRIIMHPEYKRAFNYHDLAILQLEYPVEFTYAVYPTCLMTESLTVEEGNDIPLSILGWKAFDVDGTTSTKLMKAEYLKFVNKKKCSKKYANVRTNIPNGLDDAMICVSDPDTRRRADTCSGDNGGPLLTGSKRFPQLVGVTSFGHACGGIVPGVYTSIYKNLDWIENQVWPNSD